MKKLSILFLAAMLLAGCSFPEQRAKSALEQQYGWKNVQVSSWVWTGNVHDVSYVDGNNLCTSQTLEIDGKWVIIEGKTNCSKIRNEK